MESQEEEIIIEDEYEEQEHLGEYEDNYENEEIDIKALPSHTSLFLPSHTSINIPSELSVPGEYIEPDESEGLIQETSKFSIGSEVSMVEALSSKTLKSVSFGKLSKTSKHSYISEDKSEISNISLKSKTSYKTNELRDMLNSLKEKSFLYDKARDSKASYQSNVLFKEVLEQEEFLDEFAWPTFSLKERDNIYEILLARSYANSSLAVLNSDRTLIRNDHKLMLQGKVKLLGGGRAGNDPLFAGYIGRGMLTAACFGDLYEAPKVHEILNAIIELTENHTGGLIIIIQNQYENRIAFSLAMQRARSKGIMVDMIAVADDCYDSKNSRIGREGLAGILFTIKIAGAMSESNRSMKEIFETARSLMMGTISGRLEGNEFKIGRVFEEEILKVQRESLSELVSKLLDYLVNPKRYFSLPLVPFSSIAVLVNSYTKDDLFLYTVLAEIVNQLYKCDFEVERVYAANFMTSPAIGRGLSITLLQIEDNSILQSLDDMTLTECWPKFKCSLTPQVIKTAPMKKEKIINFGVRLAPSNIVYIPVMLNYVCRGLLEIESILNTYDHKYYLGSALVKGAKAVAEANRENSIDLSSAYSFLRNLAIILEQSMQGATGILFALMFNAAAEEFISFSQFVKIELQMWGQALAGAVKALTVFGKLKEGQCTMLDALLPAVEATKRLQNETNANVYTYELMKATEQGAFETIKMNSRNHMKGDPESGALAMALIFRAINESLKEEIQLDNLNCQMKS